MTMTNQCAQYTEDAIGQNHPTLADTVNRLVVGINNFQLLKSGATLTLAPVRGNLVDINGKIYAVTVLPTLSAPTTAIQIEGMTRAAACVVTWTGHGLATGQRVSFAGITQTGWTALNGNWYPITYIGSNSFSIAVNTSGYAGDYVPGTDPGTIDRPTLQYIYLYDSSGTATLEASTTAYTIDSKGRENKTGDATRRLMGLAIAEGGAWWDTATRRGVRSWANSPSFGCAGVLSGNATTASGTQSEIAGEMRCEFIALPGDVIGLALSCDPTLSAAGFLGNSIGLDSNSAGTDGTVNATYASVNGAGAQTGSTVIKTGLATGHHYAAMLAWVTAGTGTWVGSGGPDRAMLSVWGGRP